MLELIERIGVEFGISIVVASHLLGEIERICDHLVAIRAAGCCGPTPSTASPAADAADRGGGGPRGAHDELIRRGLRPTAQQRSLLVPSAATPPGGRSGTASPTSACRWPGWNSAATTSRSCSATPAPPASERGITRRRRCPLTRTSRPRERHPRPRLQALRRPRLGRAGIVRALAWHGFRAASVRPERKAKIVPLVALVAGCLPAIVDACAISKGKSRGWSTTTSTARACAPGDARLRRRPGAELVSRDLRSRVLPLYFARPITTIDYPLAKYLAFTGACLVMMWVPLLLLYGGSIANVHSGAAVWGETGADPGAARRPDVVDRAGRGQPVPGQPDRPPGLRHRGGGDLLPATFTLAEILLQVEGDQRAPKRRPGGPARPAGQARPRHVPAWR